MNSNLPDDDNGVVLRRMQVHGDNLSRPRIIDFSVVFPNEESAKKLAALFNDRGCITKVRRSEVVSDLPWDVTVSRYMVPNHQDITTFEDELATAAAAWDGRNDGWGCFERLDADQ